MDCKRLRDFKSHHSFLSTDNYYKKSIKNQGYFYLKLIGLQWLICIWLTGPPMMEVLGRMGMEPSGTSCTIDYWHGDFKRFKAYMIILLNFGFIVPFSFLWVVESSVINVTFSENSFSYKHASLFCESL